MSWVAVAVGGGMLVGGIAGSMSDKATSSNSSGVQLNDMTKLGNQAYGASEGAFGDIQKLFGAGPGQSDYTAGINSQRDLASMLQAMQANGGMPNSSQIQQANGMADSLFGAQRLGMQQSFQDQMLASNRAAAARGLDMNDPVFRGSMMQEQTRQQAMLGAQQGAFAQQLAMQLPQQQLNYAQMRSQILTGLGDQALQNKFNLLQLGQNTLNNERQWAYQTSTKWGKGEQESGGGLKGALTGAIGGAGAGLSMASGLGALGGGGGTPGGFSSNGLPAANMQNVNANAFSNYLSMPQMSAQSGSQFGGMGNYSLGAFGNTPAAPRMPAPSAAAPSYQPNWPANSGPQLPYGPWAGNLGFQR